MYPIKVRFATVDGQLRTHTDTMRGPGFAAPVAVGCRGLTFGTSTRCRNGDLIAESSARRRAKRSRFVVARERSGPPPDPFVPDALHLTPTMKDIDRNPFDFGQLEGKVVYAVNVASHDEYTDSNYKMMAGMYEEFRESGFEILAFPSNWFGQKETGSNEEIKEFVRSEYNTDIIIMDKFDYEENPVFALGQKHFPGEIYWNFHGKFLFSRSGIPIARFDLLTTAEHIMGKIQEALAA